MVATTPRRPRRASTSAEGVADPLHPELELALVLGRGVCGLPVELRHVDGWRRAWAEYGDIVAPKVAEYLPGVRPWCRYVLGELEPPPVMHEPPLAADYWREWIAGTGRYWVRYPEPWQKNETAWLLEIGEVGPAEYERFLVRKRRPVPATFRGVWRLLGDEYPLEATIAGKLDP